MNDSSINPLLLTSAAHLENVEQLIKNLEKHTLDLDNFDEILSDRKRQELITKSFSSVTSNTMAIDDVPDDSFLVKSISLQNTASTLAGFNNDNLSMDSLLNHRDLFESADMKKQLTPPANDQSLFNDPDGGFSWDHQYDTRANYRLTFSTDKVPQSETKSEKPHRHKPHRHRHHHHHHHHQQQQQLHQNKNQLTDSQTSSTYSDDALTPDITANMNDWSMQSSFNTFEQPAEQRDNKTPVPSTNDQRATMVRSQSHPSSFLLQQNLPNDDKYGNNNNNNNVSPNSSTTSSSSSASWKRMKESQRTTSGVEQKETQSPMGLYKIFQQKSQMATSSSSSPRSAFQYYRQPNDSVVPNAADSMTISGEKMSLEKQKSPSGQRLSTQNERSSSQTSSSADQAIQTSILLDNSSNSDMNSRLLPTPTINYLQTNTGTNSSHHLTVPARPSPLPSSSSAINKSLPDLAFISQYTKELPRSRTASPLPPTPTPPVSLAVNVNNHVTPSPTVTQQRQESDRPRTLKSIKRYKNSKHSTEPLGVFFSPQLGKTFAAVPASAVIAGSNETPTIIKMKLPPPSSYSKAQQQASNLKSCLKYGGRANSCDIQAMLQERTSPAPNFNLPMPVKDQESSSPTSKRRCSEADVPENRSNDQWSTNAYRAGSSNNINSYAVQDNSQNQTKKSVSFSENIAKQLLAPCNPAINFNPSEEVLSSNDDEMAPNNDNLVAALHGDQRNLTKKKTLRYGEMRRCQTDLIAVDRIHHLHSFTESPPNEFRLQETDSLVPQQEDEDDQCIMEKTHVNVIDNADESPVTSPPMANANNSNQTADAMTSSNDKENKIPEQSSIMNVSTVTTIQTDDPFLDSLLPKMSGTIKRIFEIKRSEKTIFLNNENNAQLDDLIKNDLCTILRNILEHGLKPQRKDLPLAKQTTLWKIIEVSIDHGQALQVFTEAKQIAQNTSPYWLYKYQAFIFALLNKNELINWVYHFTKQKGILQRYYQSTDALILSSTETTFQLLDRLMAQLEKLSPLAFRLVYKPDPIPTDIEAQLNTSTANGNPTKAGSRDWGFSAISKRTTRTVTQPIIPSNANVPSNAIAPSPPTTAASQPTDTFRATLSRKLNSLFTKGNSAQAQPPTQRKSTSTVTAKLPTTKPQNIRAPSPASTATTTTATRQPPVTNVFANATAGSNNQPVIVSSPKLNNASRTGAMRRGISPSVVVAPSPPPTLNTTATTPSTTSAFQSKIPRPSLNVDKPKSARYRSTAPPPK